MGCISKPTLFNYLVSTHRPTKLAWVWGVCLGYEYRNMPPSLERSARAVPLQGFPYPRLWEQINRDGETLRQKGAVENIFGDGGTSEDGSIRRCKKKYQLSARSGETSMIQ